MFEHHFKYVYKVDADSYVLQCRYSYKAAFTLANMYETCTTCVHVCTVNQR